MFDLNLALVVVSGVVLVLGLFSNYIRDRTWISEPMLAMLFGVMAGPFLLDLLPFYWSRYDSLLEVVARLTLAIGLMAVALRLPDRYTVRHWRSLAVLICILMPLMWLMTAAILIVFLGLETGFIGWGGCNADRSHCGFLHYYWQSRRKIFASPVKKSAFD